MAPKRHAVRLRWQSMTPLLAPVVPEVKRMVAKRIDIQVTGQGCGLALGDQLMSGSDHILQRLAERLGSACADVHGQ